VVKEAGHEISVELGNEENIMGLLRRHSPDIVGVTCLTVSYPIARNMINIIKESFPDILTIIGGHHATFMTREIFSECRVDFILRGEGEIAFPLLLTRLEAGNRYPIVEGIAYRRGNGIFNEHSFTLLDNIDSLPKITRDLVPTEAKNYTPMISTSRGCPHRCSFCSISAFYKGRWRSRKIESVLDEIEMYSSNGHSKSFQFSDDNFTNNTARVKKLCDGLRERGLDDLKWSCLGRVDSVSRDPEMVDVMADTGCNFMSLGVESGAQEILETYKKRITLDHVQRAIEIMGDSSIFHGWFFIIGSGGELDRPKYIEKSIDFMKRIKFDLLQISIMTPFPGTEFYNNLCSDDRLLNRDWEKYDCTHCMYQPIHMTPGQIEDYFVKAYETLYLERGLDLISMGWNGFRAGFIPPTMILNSARYALNIFFRKKNLHGVLN
jgi:anaerobic magnesium-protoporphyrin IX monomethyl ester cyclase